MDSFHLSSSVVMQQINSISVEMKEPSHCNTATADDNCILTDLTQENPKTEQTADSKGYTHSYCVKIQLRLI